MCSSRNPRTLPRISLISGVRVKSGILVRPRWLLWVIRRARLYHEDGWNWLSITHLRPIGVAESVTLIGRRAGAGKEALERSAEPLDICAARRVWPEHVALPVDNH